MRHLTCAIVAITCLLIGQASQAAECDEQVGFRDYEAGDFVSAYDHLSGCSNHRGASGEALMELADLYAFGFGDFDSMQARATAFWKLYHRASLLGDQGAITALANLYELGNQDVPIEPNQRTASCLMEASDIKDDGKRRKRVRACTTRLVRR